MMTEQERDDALVLALTDEQLIQLGARIDQARKTAAAFERSKERLLTGLGAVLSALTDPCAERVMFDDQTQADLYQARELLGSVYQRATGQIDPPLTASTQTDTSTPTALNSPSRPL